MVYVFSETGVKTIEVYTIFVPYCLLCA